MSESEYTPTVRKVRRVYAFAPVNFAACNHLNTDSEYAGLQFDRWLAEVERKAAEKAWERGARVAVELGVMPHSIDGFIADANPYQQQEEQ